MRKPGATYKRSGVDVAGANAWIARMRPLIRSTWSSAVVTDRGQFAGLFRLARGSVREHVLVASADGVGTKLKVAQLANSHEGIGVDVVAMNVNDVIACGARPLFFLDYLAMGKLKPSLAGSLLRGVIRGCRESSCALLGGETAEMPGVYRRGEYDLAGFCVGVAQKGALINGSTTRPQDAIIGMASSGLHSNGFSLVRQLFTKRQLVKLRGELLRPTRIYVKAVLRILSGVELHAIAHVTGGGLSRRINSLILKRPHLRARLFMGSWEIPSVFRMIQEAGGISASEMMATFNMGIGMALACRPQDVGRVVRIAHQMGIPAWPIGAIERAR